MFSLMLPSHFCFVFPEGFTTEIMYAFIFTSSKLNVQSFSVYLIELV
jgi:hypothetical protein